MLVCFCLRRRVLPVVLRFRRWLLASRYWSAAWLLVLLVLLVLPRRRAACLRLARRVWLRLVWHLRLRRLMRRLLAPPPRRRLSPPSRAVLSRLARLLPRWLVRLLLRLPRSLLAHRLALRLWHRQHRHLQLRLALPWRVTPRWRPILRRRRIPRLLLQQLRRLLPPRL